MCILAGHNLATLAETHIFYCLYSKTNMYLQKIMDFLYKWEEEEKKKKKQR